MDHREGQQDVQFDFSIHQLLVKRGKVKHEKQNKFNLLQS